MNPVSEMALVIPHPYDARQQKVVIGLFKTKTPKIAENISDTTMIR